VSRRALLALLASLTAALLAGCGLQASYPLPGEPPGDAAFHPVAVGETVSEAVLFIEPREGTRVEIVGADPVGQLQDASVDFHASPLVEGADGAVEVGDERLELEGLVIGGGVFASADPSAETIAIVADITPSEPGRFLLTGVRLSYRLNGAPPRDGEGIDVVVTVCADDPAPSDCDE
jgi:hypothetical protein